MDCHKHLLLHYAILWRVIRKKKTREQWIKFMRFDENSSNFFLLSDIIVSDTRIFAAIFFLHVRYVNMTNYIIMHSHVLSHEKTRTIRYLRN